MQKLEKVSGMDKKTDVFRIFYRFGRSEKLVKYKLRVFIKGGCFNETETDQRITVCDNGRRTSGRLRKFKFSGNIRKFQIFR